MNEKHSLPVLASPKGLFWTGFALGILATLAVSFVLTVTRALKMGRLAARLAVPAAPSAEEAPAEETPVADPRPVGKDDHVRGTGPVTVIEYSDLECPFCKMFHAELKRAQELAPGKFRWVYRHFPLTQLHPKAQREAEAAECAGEQGKFWEFVDKTFEVTPSNDGLDPGKLPDIAKLAGVPDLKKFSACLASGAWTGRVRADAEDAVAVGGDGTPYTVVLGANGLKDVMIGSIEAEQVVQLVDALSR